MDDDPSNQVKSTEVLLTTLRTIPKAVDLQLPLGPKIPYTFHFLIVKERSLTAVIGPNLLVRFVKVRMVFNCDYFWLLY